MDWRRQVNKERVSSLADAANSILNLGESIVGGNSVLYPADTHLKDLRKSAVDISHVTEFIVGQDQ